MTQPKTQRSKPAADEGAHQAPEFHIAHVREDGVHLHGEGGLPLNHRLRAEELVAAGKDKDPEGLISKALIADTKARLEAEAEAEAEAAAAATAKTKAEGDEGKAVEQPLTSTETDPADQADQETDQ